MTTFVQCPQCSQTHEQPLEATLGLIVPCPDCSLAAERAA
jgi:hypothetical protein